ncbi:Transcription factor [Aspergillus sclerotialis]|uniref:Putative transcription factor kapC n=1 Tax=Aspergillus sclerotialis TaxID=2070753 RepID=A0A3A3A242_9EURO|nr:Transcription factor [Aspergillus sclerotialis]
MLQSAQGHMPHPAPARPQVPAAQSPHMQPTAASPRDQNNIDPAISGTAMMGPPPATPPQPEQEAGDESPKSYGKRPLSTSKRAAQNRAAQRAFRQRKETYIRKLEEQVKNYEHLSENYKALQDENYSLREHIINLQSRLLDSQGEVPELPSNIDLSQPRPDMPVPPSGPTVAGQSAAQNIAQQHQAHHQPGPNDDMNSLNQIAVAGLGMRKRPNEEAGNFMGNNNFQQTKRRNDGTQQASAEVPKTEVTHGLPNMS